MYDYIAESLRTLAVPLSELETDARNARKHDERSVAAIAASLARFGQRKPIVVNRNGGTTIAGSGTILAARQLEWDALAVVWVDDTEETARAFAIADNQTALLSDWDDTVLAEQLQMLVAAGETTALGFEDDEIIGLIVAASNAQDGPPELPPHTRVTMPPAPPERARPDYIDESEDEQDILSSDAEEEGDEDDSPAVIDDGKNSRSMPQLVFGTRRVPMTNEELEAMIIVHDTYVRKSGVSYGFVAWLLDAEEQKGH